MNSREPAAPDAPLRAIGDVHGCLDAFAAAAETGRRDGRFVLQLGDLVDRGPDSAGCLRLALGLRESGAGQFIRGNHDDKLARLLAGNSVQVGAELARTREQIAAAPDATRLMKAFLDLWQDAPWWWLWGEYLFVHGAFHPAMLDHADPRTVTPRRLRDKLQWLAIYGEGQMDADATLPQRTYRWVATIPAGLTVVVGHDVRSEVAPLIETNAEGGKVIFLDTGCGKGGRLSWLDIGPQGGEHIETSACFGA